MQRVFPVLVLSVSMLARADAQRRWSPELGVQGGIARIKPAGTGAADQVDLWDVPGLTFAKGMPTYAAIYAVVPLVQPIALEPSIALSDFASLVGASHLTLGLRGNVALAAGLYAAAGGVVSYRQSVDPSSVSAALVGSHQTQLGLQAALGYRFAPAHRLRARIEVLAIAMRGTDSLAPANVYAALIGLSAGSLPRSTSETRKPAHWERVFGAAGGYTRTHLNGGQFGSGDFGSLAVPGHGTGSASRGYSLESAVPSPPTLFVILPLAGRVALEGGFDAHRIQGSDTTTTTWQFAPRVDVAVVGNWFVAVGGNVHFFQRTGQRGYAVVGANGALGYRFPLAADIGGRFEINYTTLKERANTGVAATTIGLMFGAMLPLH